MEGVWMQISFNLDTERFKLLRQQAIEQSLSVGDVVTQIVSNFLDQSSKSVSNVTQS